MALDGNGNYSPPAPQFPAIPNTIIYADDFNQIILDIATTLSTAIFRDGQAAFTANQSMGGNKLTNLATGVNPQDAVNFLQVFTDPVFVATTLQGFKISGSMFQALMTTINLVASGTVTLTGTTLLDMSASGQVKLPANTSIGPVSASELATLDGLTASTTELNVLDGMTASTAELNILDGAVISTAELNALDRVTANVQDQIDLKAPLDSPALTGNPTAPTPAAGDADTSIATTGFVQGEILAKANLDGGNTFTGTQNMVASLGDGSTATTQPTGNNSTKVATTAFVVATAFNSALPGQAGNAGKFAATDGLNAYWAEIPKPDLLSMSLGVI